MKRKRTRTPHQKGKLNKKTSSKKFKKSPRKQKVVQKIPRETNIIENVPESKMDDTSDSDDSIEDEMSALKTELGVKEMNESDDEFSEDELIDNESSDNESCDDHLPESSETHPGDESESETSSEANNVELNDDDDASDNEILDSDHEDDTDLAKDSNFCDPFEKHLLSEIHPNLLSCLSSSPINNSNTLQYWPVLGQLLMKIPECSQNPTEGKSAIPLDEKIVYTYGAQIPKIHTISNIQDLYIKDQILKNCVNHSNTNESKRVFTAFQNELFSIINNYQDLYFTKETVKNSEDIRFVYCVHIMNHILKTRTKVIHHNAKLLEENGNVKEFRDQGLVRPKALVIVPFKVSAYKIIVLLENLLLAENKGNVMNKKRFLEEYTGNEIVMPKKNPKPLDFEQTFTGNTSDDFKIGISITKKSLKLFSDFYSSDIIIGSPLGLRTIIGAEGENERNYDFLTSIELLVLDQTEIFHMQNWDHLLHIFDHLHLQPKEFHGTDFSRVRLWSLNGQAKYYRQTLIFSSVNLPEIYSVFNKRCMNYAGQVRTVDDIEKGSLSHVTIQVPHRFYKFSAKTMVDSIETRFEFFLNSILPDHMNSQTLIFIPNYFDYVKIRNHFKKEMLSFTQICEYSKPAKVARARDIFFHGDAKFMLYTERFHFYNRIKVKGIHNLIFYGLPKFPHFYSEICNLMQEGFTNKKKANASTMAVSVIYSKYDINQLSTVVGTKRAQQMVFSERSVHMMVTGE